MAAGAVVSAASSLLSSSGSSGGGGLTSNMFNKELSGGKRFGANLLDPGGFFGLGKKKKKFEFEDLRTAEQKQADQVLQNLAFTGSGGGITLGEGFEGPLGSFDTSGSELANKQLLELFGGQDLQQSGETLRGLAQAEFNPDDPSSGFAAFSRSLAKAGGEAEDVLNRESAITGNRFSTSIGGDKANLAADMQNQRGMFLADLYRNQQQVALQAATGLQNQAAGKGNLAIGAANQAQQVNAIKDEQARRGLAEFMRARGEELSRIDLLGQVSRNNPYGIGADFINSSPSAFSSLANSALGALGQSIGSRNTSGGNINTGTFLPVSSQPTGSNTPAGVSRFVPSR